MVQSKATTVEEYLEELPVERRSAIEAVRRVILDKFAGRLRRNNAMRYDWLCRIP